MSQQNFAIETEALSSFPVFLLVAPNTRESITLFCIAGDEGDSAVFCTIKDEVFGIGRNDSGQIGTGDTGKAAEPERIGEMCGRRVRGLVGGVYHCLGVTDEGKVYSWGWNRYGQLGRGTAADAAGRPAVVEGLPEVASVACGGNHSLALTAAGEVYAWGCSTSGECGRLQGKVRRPVHVQLPRQAVVTAVAAGAWHSAALTQDGKIFCWGCNDRGQLGSGEAGGLNAGAREVAPPAGGFMRVICGWDHTLGLTRKGLVLAWGRNTGGMLGVGEAAEKVALPRKVLWLDSATGILAAGHHSVAETAAGLYHWGGNGGDDYGGPDSVDLVTKVEGTNLGSCLARGPLSLRVRRAASDADAEENFPQRSESNKLKRARVEGDTPPETVKPSKEASSAVEVTVMDCSYPKVLLDGEQQEAVEQDILEAYDAGDAGNPGIQVRLNGCTQGRGYVVINCADAVSAGWVMKVVQRKKPSLKALVLPVDCTACVPQGKGQSLTAAKFLHHLNLSNRSLDTKQWAMWDTLTEGGQVWSISMDEKSLEELQRLDMKPYFRIGRIHFQVKKKPEPGGLRTQPPEWVITSDGAKTKL